MRTMWLLQPRNQKWPAKLGVQPTHLLNTMANSETNAGCDAEDQRFLFSPAQDYPGFAEIGARPSGQAATARVVSSA